MSEQPQQESPLTSMKKMLDKMAPHFKALLPTPEHVERFIRMVMTAAQQKPELVEADRDSFYTACMKAAQDGLLPDGIEAVLNVYNSNVGTQAKPEWRKMVQYQPMVAGMFKKLRLSGEIVGAPKVHVWHVNDEFVYELGDNERIVHRPALKDRGEIAGAYSIVKLKSGDSSREVMARSEIDGIMARSKSKDKNGDPYGPWKTDYSEMARKTVFRRHYKRLPRSTDMDNVISSDNETFEEYPDRPASTSTSVAVAPGAGKPVDVASAPAKRPAALEHVVSETIPGVTGAGKRETATIEQEKGGAVDDTII